MPLLEALKRVQQVGPENLCLGICNNLPRHLWDEFTALVLRWPKHSGNRNYPVPHPELEPEEAYYGIANIWEGEYGDNRRELLEWAIKGLESDLT